MYSKHSTQPFRWPSHTPTCCTPTQATSWLDCLAEMAVYGDDDARRALPEAVDHFLAALREAECPRLEIGLMQ